MSTAKKKKNYQKPQLTSEPLMAFGATCNGSTNGGRKATVDVPSSCLSNRLKS